MITSSVRIFSRSKNPDGTWETICPDCLHTIARVKEPADLEIIERIHDCVLFERLGIRIVTHAECRANHLHDSSQLRYPNLTLP
jgi:hypothetical protein